MNKSTTTKPEPRAYFRWEAPQNYSRDPNEQRFGCNVCWDSGWVTVWHSKSEFFVSQSKLDEAGEYLPHGEFVWEKHMSTAAARCTCHAGNKHSPSVPLYNPLQMALYDTLASREVNLDALVELVNRPPVATAFNGDDWNNR